MILSVCYLCLSVSQNSTGGVGVDSNGTVCLSVSQVSTGGVGVDSNVTVCLSVSQNSTGGVGVDSLSLCVSVPKLDRGGRFW